MVALLVLPEFIGRIVAQQKLIGRQMAVCTMVPTRLRRQACIQLVRGGYSVMKERYK